MSATVANTVTRGCAKVALRHKTSVRGLTLSHYNHSVWKRQNLSWSGGGGGSNRELSTTVTSSSSSSSSGGEKKKQDFVEASFDVHADGQVAWKNRAVIMSAEDFENRPKVGFDEQFASLHDGMVVLSWLSDRDKQRIYDLYLELMRTMADRHSNVTSHDYVIRVVAQKFNICKERTAAVIALSHEEERMKARGETLHDDAQQYVDAKVQHHISAAYATYNETDPNPDPNVTFVEDPIITMGSTNNHHDHPTIVDDSIDVDRIASKAKLRQQEQTKLAISNRVYAEDVDPDQTPVPITRKKECHNQLHRKNTEFASMAQPPSYYPSAQDQQQQRPRWKFVAKTINTRKDTSKNKKKKKRSKQNNKFADTLTEHNGTLRVATVKEASSTSFLKSKRNVTEFTLTNVKQAWINRQLFGEVGGWGRAPQQPKQKIHADSKDNNELSSEQTNDKTK